MSHSEVMPCVTASFGAASTNGRRDNRRCDVYDVGRRCSDVGNGRSVEHNEILRMCTREVQDICELESLDMPARTHHQCSDVFQLEQEALLATAGASAPSC